MSEDSVVGPLHASGPTLEIIQLAQLHRQRQITLPGHYRNLDHGHILELHSRQSEPLDPDEELFVGTEIESLGSEDEQDGDEGEAERAPD